MLKLSFESHEVGPPRKYITIPSLMVVTGVNGSGKTAFLDKINGNKFELWRPVDGVDQRVKRIVLLSTFQFSVSGRFEEYKSSNAHHDDIISSEIGHTFVYVRDEYFRSIIKKTIDACKSEKEYLRKDEIVQAIEGAPWDKVNSLLDEFGMNIQVIPPDLYAFGSYRLLFRLKEGSAFIECNNLSSGEKNIVYLVFMIVKAEFSFAERPEVILMDEVDAFMHPKMCNIFIEKIEKYLINKLGIQVIMVSHSVATIACCRDNPIFTMHRGHNEPKSGTKAQALSALMYGVPKLSVSFGGQRQVFVEDGSDAEILTKIYNELKPDLDSEISLQFVSTGLKKSVKQKSDEEKIISINNGRDVVIKLVTELHKRGNSSILGVIDWDGCNEERDRIFVMAKGRRYGIENIVCDPLNLAIYLYRERELIFPSDVHEFVNRHGLEPVVTSPSISQTMVREVCIKVFPRSTSAIECTYKNGLRLLVNEEFLISNGHLLIDEICSSIPFVNRKVHNNGAKNFMIDLIDSNLSLLPDIVPVELWNLFQNLEGADMQL